MWFSGASLWEPIGFQWETHGYSHPMKVA